MLRSIRPDNNREAPPVFVASDSGRKSFGRRRFRQNPILYGIIVVMVIEFLTGMATGFDLSVRLYYALGILLISGLFWARSSSRNMSAEVERLNGPY